jgi:hypothetical protein
MISRAKRTPSSILIIALAIAAAILGISYFGSQKGTSSAATLEKVIFLSETGDDANNGDSSSAAVRTLRRAFELTNQSTSAVILLVGAKYSVLNKDEQNILNNSVSRLRISSASPGQTTAVSSATGSVQLSVGIRNLDISGLSFTRTGLRLDVGGRYAMASKPIVVVRNNVFINDAQAARDPLVSVVSQTGTTVIQSNKFSLSKGGQPEKYQAIQSQARGSSSMLIADNSILFPSYENQTANDPRRLTRYIGILTDTIDKGATTSVVGNMFLTEGGASRIDYYAFDPYSIGIEASGAQLQLDIRQNDFSAYNGQDIVIRSLGSNAPIQSVKITGNRG